MVHVRWPPVREQAERVQKNVEEIQIGGRSENCAILASVVW